MLSRRGWCGGCSTRTGSSTRTRGHTPTCPVSVRQRFGTSSRIRRFLRSTFHVQANFLCYPFGAYSPTVIDAARAAGYLGATTTEYGRASRDEPYSLNRIRISHSDGVSGFARKLG